MGSGPLIQDFRAVDRQMPEIAVLLPAFNSEQFLANCLAALSENSQPHDLILVDDGSRIPVSSAMLGPYFDRAVILTLPRNAGIVAALNIGARFILSEGYQYLARQDADDLSYPDRLRRQFDVMTAAPFIGMCGAAARIVDNSGHVLGTIQRPTDHRSIVRALPFANQFTHTSMFIRTEALRQVGLYREKYERSEDYDLAFRMSKRFNVANLPDVLVDYMVHDESISARRFRQALSSLRVAIHHFKFTDWRAYAGLFRRLILLPLPRGWIVFLKLQMKR